MNSGANLFIDTLPYTLPFVIGGLTLWFNNLTARRSDTNARLTSQREDFNAVLTPIREELHEYRDMYSALKEQVDMLEDRLDREQRDKRLLIIDVAKLKNYVNATTPGDTITLHPRVEKLVNDIANGVEE